MFNFKWSVYQFLCPLWDGQPRVLLMKWNEMYFSGVSTLRDHNWSQSFFPDGSQMSQKSIIEHLLDNGNKQQSNYNMFRKRENQIVMLEAWEYANQLRSTLVQIVD